MRGPIGALGRPWKIEISQAQKYGVLKESLCLCLLGVVTDRSDAEVEVHLNVRALEPRSRLVGLKANLVVSAAMCECIFSDRGSSARGGGGQ